MHNKCIEYSRFSHILLPCWCTHWLVEWWFIFNLQHSTFYGTYNNMQMGYCILWQYRCQVSMGLSLSVIIFRVVFTRLVIVCQHCRGTYCQHLHGWRIFVSCVWFINLYVHCPLNGEHATHNGGTCCWYCQMWCIEMKGISWVLAVKHWNHRCL